MEFRRLGASGLMVPMLSLGTATFGGGSEFFKAFGSSDVAHASRLVAICLDAGVNMFDSSDVYSRGMAEEILGQASPSDEDLSMSGRERPIVSTDSVTPSEIRTTAAIL